jgi:hypothetical protein
LEKKNVLPKKKQKIMDKSIVANKCGNTVTSRRARYQTLLRCLQSTASCCLNIIILLVHKAGNVNKTDTARARITLLRGDTESYNFFYTNLMRTFPETNIPQVIELLVATNIMLSALESDVCPPGPDGNYVHEPLFILYKFLLRICDESPILVMVADDEKGSHCSHVKESLEYFVSEQLHLKQMPFTPL